MKSSVKLGVILIGLAIFGNAEVWGADWKLFTTHDKFLLFYDTKSITHPSKNIVRAWVRQNFTEKGVIDHVGKFGKKYENLSHSKNLMETNCVEKTVRYLSYAYYDNKGEVIYSSDSPSEWQFIIPDSMGEGLYQEVCK